MKFVKLLFLLIIGLTAIAGIVFIMSRYIDVLMRPINSHFLNKRREASGEACAYAVGSDYFGE